MDTIPEHDLLPQESPVSLRTVPPDHPVRVRVDGHNAQIAEAESNPAIFNRQHEERYRLDRSGEEYIEGMQGLLHFFSYATSLADRNIILDIGAGNAKGIKELSQWSILDGQTVKATTLKRHPHIVYRFPKEDIHETPVEYLEGIEDGSVSGILGLISLTYSAAPEHAVIRMDEVLKPGGVIKALFRHPEFTKAKYAQDHRRFTEQMKKLGYDVALYENPHWDAVLAIKPGGEHPESAESLLTQDRETVQVQIEHLRNSQH